MIDASKLKNRAIVSPPKKRSIRKRPGVETPRDSDASERKEAEAAAGKPLAHKPCRVRH